ncbi:MAG: hypothetical protein KDK24_21760 [Pseudooceanicola sp.]|nr:hypothetical protein [Pseudooceanicola sp.]
MTTQTPEEVLFGDPPSDAYKPKKSELRDLLDEIIADRLGTPFVSLVLGQSNARGVAEATSGDKTASPYVNLWNSSSSGTTYTQGTQFNVAAFGTAPLNVGSSPWSNNLGFHAAKAIYERTRRVQYQIQVALGSHATEAFISDADLSANSWTRPVDNADLNTAMHTALTTALPLVPGAPTRLDAVFIHQGEAKDEDQVEVFAMKWGVVLQDLKDAGYIDEMTVIVMGELAAVQNNTYGKRHLNALRRIQIDWPRVKIARSTGLPSHTSGNVHFSGESLAKFGRRYADAAFSEQAPYFPEAIGGDLTVDGGLAWASTTGGDFTGSFDLAARPMRPVNNVPSIVDDPDLGWCYEQQANAQLILPSRHIYRVPEGGVFRVTYEIKVIDNPGTADCRCTVYEWDVDRAYMGSNGFAPPGGISPVDYADGRVIVSGTFGRAGSGADFEFSSTAMWFCPAFFAGGGGDDAAFRFNILAFRFESPPADEAEGPEVTIASGAISISRGSHPVDTEANASSDDLDTISVDGIPNGKRLTIYPADGARTIVAKDGTGNLLLAGDFTMDNKNDVLTLIKRGTDWVEVSRADVGG